MMNPWAASNICTLANPTATAATTNAPTQNTTRRHHNRGDTRDFQNNGFFPGDFAANPPAAWIGAAGIIGFTPAGGSHFGPIYCTRRYCSHNPAPGYFQGDDGVWYRCQR